MSDIGKDTARQQYQLSEIPVLDGAEFDLYRAGRRIGLWFYQSIEDNILSIGHDAIGWVPVGKTEDDRVLRLSSYPCKFAIMYQKKTEPEDMIWFHVE